jgi:hypothetical protein
MLVSLLLLVVLRLVSLHPQVTLSWSWILLTQQQKSGVHPQWNPLKLILRVARLME